MSKEYTKEEMLKAYKAGWNNALNGVGSLNTEAAFEEWLERLRPKVEEPPRPTVRWDGLACYVNEILVGSLVCPFGTFYSIRYMPAECWAWGVPSFHHGEENAKQMSERYFIRAYNVYVGERSGDGC